MKLLEPALALIAPVVRFVRDTGTPVLVPYRLQRPPLERGVRYLLFFSVLILLGLIYGFYSAVLPRFFWLYMSMPIIALALLLIWSLPDRATAPTVAMERFFWGFWISMIVWPNYLAIALPGLPWITVNRLFGGPMLLLLLIVISTSPAFRAEARKPLDANPAVVRMLIGFVIAQFASIFFSNVPFLTLNKVFNLQIVWTAMFFVCAWVFLKPGRIMRWASLMCMMAVFVSVIGLFEARNQQILWANHIPSFLQIEDEAVIRTLTARYRAGEYRVTSTFMISLSFAEYLALTSPFMIHIIMTTRKMAVRLACIAADILLLTGILYSQARLGMVGFLLAHAVYGLFWAIRRWRTDRMSILGPALALGYPALLAMFAFAVVSFGRIRVLVLGGGQHQASNDARQAQYEMVLPVLMRRPVFGFGGGEGGVALGYKNQGGEGTVDTYIITILLDYGLVGFIMFYGMLFWGMYKAAQISIRATDRELSYAIPVAIMLGVFFVIKTVLSQESNIPIMFMLLGMVAAMTVRDKAARA